MGGYMDNTRGVPGQRMAYVYNEHDLCDHEGCDKPATGRVATEADSYGIEYSDFCNQHLLEFHVAFRKKRDEVAVCDICKNESIDLRMIRDPEEGLAGRFYNACPSCRARITEAFMDDEE